MTPDSTRDVVTPEAVYRDRRNFMRAGLVAATAVGTGLIYRALNAVSTETVATAALDGVVAAPPEFRTDEAQTSFQDITHYNNFYEFTTSKEGVAEASRDFTTTGWKLALSGLCESPQVFDLAQILSMAPTEERVYRMRCVEAWSMVIPWAGFPLSTLLSAVKPLPSAKFVAFTTLLDPTRMPGQKTSALPWPYVEGLRMDEAMHPLTLLASGLYGRALPPQDGAPLRLVVPWKYGFKGIKSIVEIRLVDAMPPTTWNTAASSEYGFYANVNPDHPHPRWSQATEQRIGQSGRRATLPFNGYADQVASLYAGQDLHVDF